jgi:membrane-bound ClpP family serine protease
MQSRRVGTLTLGVLLIILGILYILITIFNMPLEKKILDFWPLILISLGIEILVLNNQAIKNNLTLKYDFTSFILIIIMLVFSFSTFTASKLIGEFLNPSSSLFYRNYIHIY